MTGGVRRSLFKDSADGGTHGATNVAMHSDEVFEVSSDEYRSAGERLRTDATALFVESRESLARTDEVYTTKYGVPLGVRTAAESVLFCTLFCNFVFLFILLQCRESAAPGAGIIANLQQVFNPLTPLMVKVVTVMFCASLALTLLSGAAVIALRHFDKKTEKNLIAQMLRLARLHETKVHNAIAKSARLHIASIEELNAYTDRVSMCMFNVEEHRLTLDSLLCSHEKLQAMLTKCADDIMNKAESLNPKVLDFAIRVKNDAVRAVDQALVQFRALQAEVAECKNDCKRTEENVRRFAQQKNSVLEDARHALAKVIHTGVQQLSSHMANLQENLAVALEEHRQGIQQHHDDIAKVYQEHMSILSDLLRDDGCAVIKACDFLRAMRDVTKDVYEKRRNGAYDPIKQHLGGGVLLQRLWSKSLDAEIACTYETLEKELQTVQQLAVKLEEESDNSDVKSQYVQECRKTIQKCTNLFLGTDGTLNKSKREALTEQMIAVLRNEDIPKDSETVKEAMEALRKTAPYLLIISHVLVISNNVDTMQEVVKSTCRTCSGINLGFEVCETLGVLPDNVDAEVPEAAPGGASSSGSSGGTENCPIQPDGASGSCSTQSDDSEKAVSPAVLHDPDIEKAGGEAGQATAV